MGILKAIWHLIIWLRKLKKDLEQDAAKVLSADNARRLRLNSEKVFAALAEGRGAEALPKSWFKFFTWLFGKTLLDELLGEFGKVYLKSNKLERKDAVLEKAIS